MHKNHHGFGFVGLIVVVVVIGLVSLTTWFVWNARSTANTKSTPTSPNAIVAKFTYSNEGFQPSSIILKKGESFRIMNQSDEPIPVDLSGPLPNNTTASSVTLDTVRPGANQVFLMNEPGSWKINNHSNPKHNASVIVRE